MNTPARSNAATLDWHSENELSSVLHYLHMFRACRHPPVLRSGRTRDNSGSSQCRSLAASAQQRRVRGLSGWRQTFP